MLIKNNRYGKCNVQQFLLSLLSHLGQTMAKRFKLIIR